MKVSRSGLYVVLSKDNLQSGRHRITGTAMFIHQHGPYSTRTTMTVIGNKLNGTGWVVPVKVHEINMSRQSRVESL